AIIHRLPIIQPAALLKRRKHFRRYRRVSMCQCAHPSPQIAYRGEHLSVSRDGPCYLDGIGQAVGRPSMSTGSPLYRVGIMINQTRGAHAERSENMVL